LMSLKEADGGEICEERDHRHDEIGLVREGAATAELGEYTV
jgi:hypothetical protein